MATRQEKGVEAQDLLVRHPAEVLWARQSPDGCELFGFARSTSTAPILDLLTKGAQALCAFTMLVTMEFGCQNSSMKLVILRSGSPRRSLMTRFQALLAIQSALYHRSKTRRAAIRRRFFRGGGASVRISLRSGAKLRTILSEEILVFIGIVELRVWRKRISIRRLSVSGRSHHFHASTATELVVGLEHFIRRVPGLTPLPQI